jgi:NADH dehydrogenase (ubiquinone) Fe-S protein 6
LRGPRPLAIRRDVSSNQPPEILRVATARVVCDGASDIPTGAALGHPRVWLEIDETGFVECGYCDRRFVLIGGPADHSEAA